MLGVADRAVVKCEVPECPLSRRYWGISGRDAEIV